jgi:uncharacterized protein (DUF2252 family)
MVDSCAFPGLRDELEMSTKSLQPKPGERQAVLKSRQNLKMARSAHAYVRGTTVQFYEWLKTAKGKVPKGPAVWICGDCHAGNLGPVASAKGKVEIEIRDLDQTVLGNPAHDLIRLALSLSTAARGSDLPGVTTVQMLEQMMIGYTDALRGRPPAERAAGKAVKPIQLVMKQALNRKWRHLAEERIEDVRPSIPLGTKFWALTKSEKKAIAELFEQPKVKELVTKFHKRDKDDAIEVLDSAYWMKGCSSLGRLRYAVLLGVGRNFCLIDIKEAIRAAAPGEQNSDAPKDHAQRVVRGACALSPFLGERMLAAKLEGRSVALRELMPQDLKLELDQITREEAVAAAKFLAGVVGRAHARQMDGATKREWRSTLLRDRSKSLDAPGWLWTSVVELVASHESAYLEHCRRYAVSSSSSSSLSSSGE